jgi:hypothetical protein
MHNHRKQTYRTYRFLLYQEYSDERNWKAQLVWDLNQANQILYNYINSLTPEITGHKEIN